MTAGKAGGLFCCRKPLLTDGLKICKTVCLLPVFCYEIEKDDTKVSS